MALSEDALLAIIDDFFPREKSCLLQGRGHDCALMAGGGPWAVTSDIFCEGSHFRLSYFSAEDLGHKALAVNLSDLAAAGAKPLAFNLNLSLKGSESEVWLRSFFHGMAQLANEHDVALSGGDLAKFGQLHICITAWGEAGQKLGRGYAVPGDVIFVVGNLGLARTGLLLLEQNPGEENSEIKEKWPVACQSHLRPIPQVQAGLSIARLSAAGVRLSLMDISDGLARDLPRLLAWSDKSKLGAELSLGKENLHPEVIAFAALSGEDVLKEAAQIAYMGGEDYGLLASCPKDEWEKVKQELPKAWLLGHVLEHGEGLILNGEKQEQAGFDHFQSG